MNIVPEIKKEIEMKYGDLQNPCGAYVNGQWLSIEKIIEIIDSVAQRHASADPDPHKYDVCFTVTPPKTPMIAKGFLLCSPHPLDLENKGLSFHRLCVEYARLTGTPCSEPALNIISVEKRNVEL